MVYDTKTLFKSLHEKKNQVKLPVEYIDVTKGVPKVQYWALCYFSLPYVFEGLNG